MNACWRSGDTVLFVDGRWRGNHGIARYAREVTSRLKLERCWFYRQGDDPLSLTGTLRACTAAAGNYAYTPGFNCVSLRPARTIITIHDLMHLRIPAYRSFRNLVYYNGYVKQVCRRAPFVFSVSSHVRDQIVKWADVDPEQVIVTGAGVSDLFSPGPDRYQPGFPYFLWVGNAKPHKNAGVLLEAFRNARLPSDFRLIAVGDMASDDMKMLDGDTADRMVMRGAIGDEDLVRLYRGARALVQPSIDEGFGLPVLEGMACGAELILSDIPAFRELAGMSANYFDARSVTDLTRLLEVVAHRTPIAINGRLERGHEWSDVAGVVRDALQRFT